MKRSEALTSLSHDHHQALTIALRLRRSDQANAAADRQEFLRFWAEHERHFELEEQILLPAFAEHAGADQPLARQTVAEHEEMRRQAKAIVESETADAEALARFGEQLNRHVRMEERELFPLIEQTLPAEQLAAVAAKLAEAEPGHGERVHFRP